MSAFIELAKFCTQHPEIRAHKMIGLLLQDVEQELAALKKKESDNRKGWDDCYEVNTQLRARLDEARKVMEMIFDHDVTNIAVINSATEWLKANDK
jgi:hypothetical protein